MFTATFVEYFALTLLIHFFFINNIENTFENVN